MRHRLEPTAKPLGRIVLEVLHRLGQAQERGLGHILRIRVLETPAPGPIINVATIDGHEVTPGGLVDRELPQSTKQRRTCRRRLASACHVLLSKRRLSELKSSPSFRRNASTKPSSHSHRILFSRSREGGPDQWLGRGDAWSPRPMNTNVSGPV